MFGFIKYLVVSVQIILKKTKERLYEPID